MEQMIYDLEMKDGKNVKAINIGYNPEAKKNVALFRDERDIVAIMFSTNYSKPNIDEEDTEIRELTSSEQRFATKYLEIMEI